MFRIGGDYSEYYDDEDPNYPGGKAIPASGPEKIDGTSWRCLLFNDIHGAKQAIYIAAFGSLDSITNNPDNANDSDILRAILKIINDKVSVKENSENKKTAITDSDTDYPTGKAVKTQLDLKANDANVVKLTGNQTVAGVKTFSSSPVVPSKTTAATNTGTALATEAQVFLKANDANVVKLSDDQTIAGVKTFSDIPILPAIDPTSDNHVVRKAYVDALVQGLDPKASCRVATTANITLSGTKTIDGITVAVGDRVLVKNQTTASANGIYVVASGTWARAADFNTAAKITPGAYIFIEQGTVNEDTGWVLSTDGVIAVGTTALNFTQFSAAGIVTVSGDSDYISVVKTGQNYGLALKSLDITDSNNSFNGEIQLSGGSFPIKTILQRFFKNISYIFNYIGQPTYKVDYKLTQNSYYFSFSVSPVRDPVFTENTSQTFSRIGSVVSFLNAMKTYFPRLKISNRPVVITSISGLWKGSQINYITLMLNPNGLYTLYINTVTETDTYILDAVCGFLFDVSVSRID